MRGIFITSPGTGLGKTLVTAAILYQARRAGRPVRAIKPVISGYAPDDPGSDTAILARLQGLGKDDHDRISPWRFAAPLAPTAAARRAGEALDYAAILSFCRRMVDKNPDGLLIEGAGGTHVPLTDRHLTLDLIEDLGVPALVVAGSYLGTISHTLAAMGALRARDIPVAGLILNETGQTLMPLAETRDEIAAHSGLADIDIRLIPRLPDPAPWEQAPPLQDLL